MSLKSFAKSRSRVKVSDVWGIWFQILGPQTENARLPNWVRVRTTKAALAVEERSWHYTYFNIDLPLISTCLRTIC